MSNKLLVHKSKLRSLRSLRDMTFSRPRLASKLRILRLIFSSVYFQLWWSPLAKPTFLVVIWPKTPLEKKTTRRKFSSGPLEKPYTARFNSRVELSFRVRFRRMKATYLISSSLRPFSAGPQEGYPKVLF